jgi:hypothetical protein
LAFVARPQRINRPPNVTAIINTFLSDDVIPPRPSAVIAPVSEEEGGVFDESVVNALGVNTAVASGMDDEVVGGGVPDSSIVLDRKSFEVQRSDVPNISGPSNIEDDLGDLSESSNAENAGKVKGGGFTSNVETREVAEVVEAAWVAETAVIVEAAGVVNAAGVMEVDEIEKAGEVVGGDLTSNAETREVATGMEVLGDELIDCVEVWDRNIVPWVENFVEGWGILVFDFQEYDLWVESKHCDPRWIHSYYHCYCD